MRPGQPGSIPVLLLTGFLGSGKTTLLNGILSGPAWASSAVVVNEFGDTALAHLLVETADDRIALLPNGCLCCASTGSLADALEMLRRRAASGGLPQIRQMFVETSGLADVGAILRAVAAAPAFRTQFRLAGIVATANVLALDAVLRNNDGAGQLAYADWVVLTHGDGADAQICETARRRVQALNPLAGIFEASSGRVGEDLHEALRAACRGTRQASPFRAVPVSGHLRHRDGDTIGSFVLEVSRPVDARRLGRWLRAVVSLRGPQILRIKGVVPTAGKLVAVDAAAGLLYPLRALDGAPAAPGRLVVIAAGLGREAVTASFRHSVG